MERPQSRRGCWRRFQPNNMFCTPFCGWSRAEKKRQADDHITLFFGDAGPQARAERLFSATPGRRPGQNGLANCGVDGLCILHRPDEVPAIIQNINLV